MMVTAVMANAVPGTCRRHSVNVPALSCCWRDRGWTPAKTIKLGPVHGEKSEFTRRGDEVDTADGR